MVERVDPLVLRNRPTRKTCIVCQSVCDKGVEIRTERAGKTIGTWCSFDCWEITKTRGRTHDPKPT